MKLNTKDWWIILKNTFQNFFAGDAFKHSAAIAYYAIFSLPGIALISVLIAGSFYENETVREELVKQVSLLMGKSSGAQIETLMSKASINADSLIMKIVGSITLLISATTVFVSLQDSINYVWNIKPSPDRKVLKFFFNRLISLAMVASIGFLILISLMVDTLIALLKHTISNFVGELSYVFILVINISISLVIVTLVFALIFKVLPDVKLKWKDVWTGAIVTTLLFGIGKFLIEFYLSSSSLNDVYGAAGSLVVLLAWVYYSILILLFGAQFTFCYNQYKGVAIKPMEDAVAVEHKEIEKGNQDVTKI